LALLNLAKLIIIHELKFHKIIQHSFVYRVLSWEENMREREKIRETYSEPMYLVQIVSSFSKFSSKLMGTLVMALQVMNKYLLKVHKYKVRMILTKKSTYLLRECSLMTSHVFWSFLTYLSTYFVLLYNVRFWGLSWTPLPTLISDVIYVSLGLLSLK
jgi:hypothetical protein